MLLVSAQASQSVETHGFTMNSPLGVLSVQLTSKGIFSLSFEAESLSTQVADVYLDLEEQIRNTLNAYFAGGPVDFNLVPVDFIQGTPFQKAVWQALREIPYGETQTYGWIGQRIGSPSAFRAVGQANRRNPIPIIVPCHRVVQRNGQLGGYMGTQGVKIKEFLLTLEQSSRQ